MKIVVNANIHNGTIELLGVSLTVAEAVELKSSIDGACATVTAAPTAPGEKQ